MNGAAWLVLSLTLVLFLTTWGFLEWDRIQVERERMEKRSLAEEASLRARAREIQARRRQQEKNSVSAGVDGATGELRKPMSGFPAPMKAPSHLANQRPSLYPVPVGNQVRSVPIPLNAGIRSGVPSAGVVPHRIPESDMRHRFRNRVESARGRH